ncbi:cytochrome c maturation protein CcmE [candidate division KSB1 bacterium]|nr:cytochrome c maturation protein CcmE [candidate division KSB1 bacterium]
MNTSFKRGVVLFIVAIVVVAALVMAFTAFKSSLINYVTIAEAKNSPRTVQVVGALVDGSVKFDFDSNHLFFTLRDEHNDEIRIQYNKPKPANMEGAPQIVAIGKYNPAVQLFEANEILVKCPSKYEGNSNIK